jgi:hypothetical protein
MAVYKLPALELLAGGKKGVGRGQSSSQRVEGQVGVGYT